MKKWLPAVALIALIAVVWRGARRAAPPEVSFARATRERLVSTLVTNGKTEPLEWARVRAARAGTVRRVAVERGGAVAANDVLAELDPGAAPADLAAAEARIAQALAEIETLDRGGREADRADIDGQLARVRLELQQAESEAAALSRLAEKNAATRREAEAAGESVLKLREQARGAGGEEGGAGSGGGPQDRRGAVAGGAGGGGGGAEGNRVEPDSRAHGRRRL